MEKQDNDVIATVILAMESDPEFAVGEDAKLTTPIDDDAWSNALTLDSFANDSDWSTADVANDSLLEPNVERSTVGRVRQKFSAHPFVTVGIALASAGILTAGILGVASLIRAGRNNLST